MSKETKAVTIHVSMSAYQRDLIDFHARMLHMSRSQYIVQTAAFGKRSFSLNLDAMPDEVKRRYNVYHTDNPAAGYMPTPDGSKPRKAEDGRIRDQRISLRVSPYERETLKRHAASMGLSLTDYLVYCGLYQSDARKGSRSRFMAARGASSDLRRASGSGPKPQPDRGGGEPHRLAHGARDAHDGRGRRAHRPLGGQAPRRGLRHEGRDQQGDRTRLRDLGRGRRQEGRLRAGGGPCPLRRAEHRRRATIRSDP